MVCQASLTVMKMEKKIKKPEKRIQFEICVRCHKQLQIPVDLEIDYRSCYVEGAGQLCYDCYHEIYKLEKGSFTNEKSGTV